MNSGYIMIIYAVFSAIIIAIASAVKGSITSGFELATLPLSIGFYLLFIFLCFIENESEGDSS